MSGLGAGYVRSCPDMFGQRPDMSDQNRSTKQNVNKSCFSPRILIKLDTKTHQHLRNIILEG
jgi:hypothetical protein